MSTFSLTPDPKISLYVPVFTQQNTPRHKLQSYDWWPKSGCVTCTGTKSVHQRFTAVIHKQSKWTRSFLEIWAQTSFLIKSLVQRYQYKSHMTLFQYQINITVWYLMVSVYFISFPPNVQKLYLNMELHFFVKRKTWLMQKSLILIN